MMCEKNKIKKEQIEELYSFLQGEVPEGLTIENPPVLTQEQAFSVIWYLQEQLKVLPDHFEQCNTCKVMFDSHSEGCLKEEGQFCDNCGY